MQAVIETTSTGRASHAPTVGDLLATPATFRAWLRVQRPELVVGRSMSAGRDPLANYLEEMTGQDAHVDAEMCWVSGESAVRTPDWAVCYIAAIDARDWGAPWTAAEALAIAEHLVTPRGGA